MKKLLAKKNNKGFSLVELIVVILIMAVIAVALAPQVMKWVGKSKESADQSNLGQIESAVSAGVADYMSTHGATVPATTYYIAKDGSGLAKTTTNTKDDSLTDDLSKCIQEVMNGKYPTPQEDTSKYFKITISTTGAVTIDIVAAVTP